MRFLIILLLTGCASNMAGDLNPEKLSIVALDTKWQIKQACGPGRLACLRQVGDNAVIYYKNRRLDALEHERGHLEHPEKFKDVFARELSRYGRSR